MDHPQAIPMQYTGAWWLRQSSDVQSAYLAGDSDCYESDVKGSAYPTGGLSEASATRVTDFLRGNQPDRGLALAVILRRVFAHDKHLYPSKQVIGNAEYWPEKHGFFNGDYWHQLIEEGRAPYVAGYLSCEINFRHWQVSSPVSYFVRAINEWYGIDKDDEMNGHRGDDKIAEILERLVDRKNRKYP